MAMVDHVLTQVLGDFQDQGEGLARLLVDVLGLQGVQDRRQLAGELNVHDGADDLGDLAHARAGGDGGVAGRRSGGLGGPGGLGRGRLLGGGLLGGGGVGHRVRSVRKVVSGVEDGRIRGLRRPR